MLINSYTRNKELIPKACKPNKWQEIKISKQVDIAKQEIKNLKYKELSLQEDNLDSSFDVIFERIDYKNLSSLLNPDLFPFLCMQSSKQDFKKQEWHCVWDYSLIEPRIVYLCSMLPVNGSQRLKNYWHCMNSEKRQDLESHSKQMLHQIALKRFQHFYILARYEKYKGLSLQACNKDLAFYYRRLGCFDIKEKDAFYLIYNPRARGNFAPEIEAGRTWNSALRKYV